MATKTTAGNDLNLYPQSTMEQWNFRSWHVGLDMGGKNQNPITAENFLIAAGPARLRQVGDDFAAKVFPLGMIEMAQFSQQKMVQPVREIGSRRSYMVSGGASGQMSITRAMYSQASLLRVLTLANDDFDGIDNLPGAPQLGPFNGDVPGNTADASFYINLQSEVFDRPIGLLFYILDQRNNPYGAFYVEEAMVASHQMSLAAQQLTLSESVSIMFDRALPVSVSGG